MRNLKYEESDPEKLLQSDRKVIVKLAEVAFNQLMKGNVMFYEEDLIESSIDLTDASVYSGICTEILKEESVIHQRKVYSFIHLSVQEFLAAFHVFYYHISCTKHTQACFDSLHKLYERVLDKDLESENGHLDLFLRFLLGVSLEYLFIAFVIATALTVTLTRRSTKTATDTPNVRSTDTPLNVKPSDHCYDKAAVAADDGVCSTIGRDMLKRNGSAVDAAIAALLCVSLFNAHSMGIGGGGVHHIQCINRLPWKELFEPSIKLAWEGFPIGRALAETIKDNENMILNNATWCEVFCNSNNTILKENDIIRFPQLAVTYRRIAEKGPDVFYDGSLTQNIVDDINAAGGNITFEDLKNYQPVLNECALNFTVGKYIFHAPDAPFGGPVLALILNILKGYNLSSSNVSTAENKLLTYHHIIEAFRAAYDSSSFQVILNYMFFDYDVQKAVTEPRAHNQFNPNKTLVEDGFDENVSDGLKLKNHIISKTSSIGKVQAVVRETDTICAASDPRKGGYPDGY
ncbi:gamma-glutamyltranspeptidase 1-like [Sinocyclocheilus grahami]|uniref:gamma-glutamyltranspeptidase 1-like n=1 Tax=Sinocyclocheilus grahami TaxID=75366 RepID=UPI0007AD0B61|nr:PREDICTED: gamma-glutamyltranspeptidase 1-like [Sinocyclocheilus grahami]